jgi:hypothetical protein
MLLLLAVEAPRGSTCTSRKFAFSPMITSMIQKKVWVLVNHARYMKSIAHRHRHIAIRPFSLITASSVFPGDREFSLGVGKEGGLSVVYTPCLPFGLFVVIIGCESSGVSLSSPRRAGFCVTSPWAWWTAG